MSLVVNLKTMEQSTILVIFFQITEYSLRTIGIELVYFFIIATRIVFIIIVINCQLASFDFYYQVLGRQSSNLPFLNSLSLALSEK